MRTFSPTSLFFHVRDKSQPRFIKHDELISIGSSYLYGIIFEFCGDKDHCYPSQTTLALLCKSSTRTVQNYTAQLVKAEYIAVKKDEKTGRNIYYLLLSPRLLALLRKLGIPTHETQISGTAAKNEGLQEAHENFSPYIRDQRDQDTPLSPLPKPAAPSPSCHSRTGFPSSAPTTQRVQGRGDFSSLSRTGAPQTTHVLHRPTEHEFENLWAAWPQAASWAIPHNRQLALRAYRRMRRARQLPPIEKLLAIVEQYKLNDSRWLNGYPPECSNWLHTRQFEKAPLVRPKKSFFGKLFGKPDPDPVLTPEERHQAEIYRAQVKALHERFTSRTFSAMPPLQPGGDADALISLWPEPERQRVPVTGFLNYLAGKGKKLDVGQLVPLAREYLDSTASPMSLAGWLRQQGGAYAAV